MTHRTLRLALLAALAWSIAVPARAVTVADVVALSRAGLSDVVLIAVIDADRTIFDLDAEQIIDLSRSGVSDGVLRKMIGSRREFEPAPSVPSPEVLITGVGPARPDPPPPVAVAAYPVPVVVAYPVFVGWGLSYPSYPVAGSLRVSYPTNAFGRFIADGSQRFLNTSPFGPPFSSTTPRPADGHAR